jgi:small-conductance mechanosensitive channel
MDEVSAVLDAAGVDIGKQRISALTLTKGLLAICFLIYLANLVSSLLENKVNRTESFSNVSKVLVVKTIRIGLITLAILVGVTTAGIDLSLLAVFSGALGLGIGFGLQKGISNLFSGFLLLLDKSIKPGDVIELQNGAFGWVAHMGGRFTEIVTRDNKSFLIPNEDFITQPVVNWSHGNSLIRIEVKFGVSYESDPRAVKQLVEAAACKPNRVVAHPAPVCHLVAFGDSSVDFSLRFWITDAHEGLTNVRSAVMFEIWDVFKENDIAIPYPHREVFLHKAE